MTRTPVAERRRAFHHHVRDELDARLQHGLRPDDAEGADAAAGAEAARSGDDGARVDGGAGLSGPGSWRQ